MSNLTVVTANSTHLSRLLHLGTLYFGLHEEVGSQRARVVQLQFCNERFALNPVYQFIFFIQLLLCQSSITVRFYDIWQSTKIYMIHSRRRIIMHATYAYGYGHFPVVVYLDMVFVILISLQRYSSFLQYFTLKTNAGI